VDISSARGKRGAPVYIGKKAVSHLGSEGGRLLVIEVVPRGGKPLE